MRITLPNLKHSFNFPVPVPVPVLVPVPDSGFRIPDSRYPGFPYAQTEGQTICRKPHRSYKTQIKIQSYPGLA